MNKTYVRVLGNHSADLNKWIEQVSLLDKKILELNFEIAQEEVYIFLENKNEFFISRPVIGKKLELKDSFFLRDVYLDPQKYFTLISKNWSEVLGEIEDLKAKNFIIKKMKPVLKLERSGFEKLNLKLGVYFQ